MTDDNHFKLPRLYVTASLHKGGTITLSKDQAHYLTNVLRRSAGAQLRLFNGQDGEWLATLEPTSKKSANAVITEQIKQQPQQTKRTHLIFAPIKKNRMDWLIEKAVELSVTDFHPILTQNTEVRKINEARLKAQIFEAAEQCERFEIPVLHDLKKLDSLLTNWSKDIQILSCIERFDAQPIQKIEQIGDAVAVLIGPEGGFTTQEKETTAKKTIPVTLGDTVLRCETAVAKALVLLES